MTDISNTTISLAKKNARIIAVGDGTYVMYTWDPSISKRDKLAFVNYTEAQTYAKKFMGY